MAKSHSKFVAGPPPMKPRRWAKPCLGMILVAVPLAVALVMAAQAPQFYLDRLEAADDQSQEELANQFLNSGTRLYNSIITGSNAWKETFTEASINAWFAHDLKRNHLRALPRGVSEPRVALDADCLRVGFRWGVGPLTSVVQIAIKTWVPKENNLAVELKGASAGSLPLPTTYVRSIVESVAERNGCEVRWKRNGANLVALITLPAAKRGIELRRAEVSEGAVTLSGRSTPMVGVQREKVVR
jgi:hypothetical protein